MGQIISYLRYYYYSKLVNNFPLNMKSAEKSKHFVNIKIQKTFLLPSINDTGIFMPVTTSYCHLYLPLPIT